MLSLEIFEIAKQHTILSLMDSKIIQAGFKLLMQLFDYSNLDKRIH